MSFDASQSPRGASRSRRAHHPALVLAAALGCAACSGGGARDAGAGLDLSSASQILGQLAGNTWVMAGADLPPYPNGVNQDLDLGANSECFVSSTLTLDGGVLVNQLELGLVAPVPDAGITRCDHTTSTGTMTLTSSSLRLDNVAADGTCFDLTIGYGRFGEEGRGQMSPDGQTVTLELYFSGWATRDRCQDGPVGDGGVQLIIAGKLVPVLGDARQVYRVAPPPPDAGAPDAGP
jgi:hypothetical protein